MLQKVQAFVEQRTPREKTILIVAAIFVFLALMDLFIISPILSQISVVNREISQTKKTIGQNLRMLSFRESILQDYSKYERYLDMGDKSEEEIIGELLKKIEMFADRQNIRILNVQPGDIVEKRNLNEYKTTLECEGTLADILTFMYDLEESDFLFRVTRYRLAPKNKKAVLMKAEIDVSRILITAEAVEDRDKAFSSAGMSPRPATPSSSEPAESVEVF